MPSVLWSSHDRSSYDRAVLTVDTGSTKLSGTTLLTIDDDPFEIHYTVITDKAGSTRTVGVRVQGPDTDRRLALSADGTGSWSVGGDVVLNLQGALDVDLAWTPATNSLPIRRLGLAVGDSAEDRVHSVGRRDVVVGFEALRLQRLRTEVSGVTVHRGALHKPPTHGLIRFLHLGGVFLRLILVVFLLRLG